MGVLALLWGSTFLWIKVALEGFSPVQVTFVRCVLASLTLLAVCFGTGQRLPRGTAMWGRIFVAAFFCNALPFTLFSVGEQSVDSGVAGVLNATTPLWSVLIGIAIGTERRVRPVRLGGLLLGFVGVVVIFAPWQQTDSVGWGALAIVGAAASYAVGFAWMGRALVGKGIPTISLSSAQILAATALTVLTLPVGGRSAVHAQATTVIAAVVLGIFATGVTFHLTYRIIADEGATNAATVGYLLPVVSVLLGAVVLDEDFSLRVAAGMVVVLVGVAMTRRQQRTPSPSASPAQSSSAPTASHAGPVLPK
ncbi:DMT family transporter [Streptomyces sp. NBC_00820]|uniref:DMT family transporter n=1 Tax=Streptomyces sp. NBC_00820 TaxID=2975842 RepID=UPI002ED188C8|nr:DMT family transporter [Streptomyces sp. NBC_00820]